jgi:hypothetical protein
MGLAGHVACMGERRVTYSVLVRKPGGKSPLGRARPRWEGNIGMDHKQIARTCAGLIWRRTGTGGELM